MGGDERTNRAMNGECEGLNEQFEQHDEYKVDKEKV